MPYAPVTLAERACRCGHAETWHRGDPGERVCTLECGCAGFRPADASWEDVEQPHALPWS